MPIAVLSAIREAGQHGITVKGGKYLEAVAEADTIVFDKTRYADKSKADSKRSCRFGDYPEDEALRIAACPGRALPSLDGEGSGGRGEKEKALSRREHSKVEYIVAHGISSYIEDKKVVIGSSHFVFEDEDCRIRQENAGAI